MANKGGTMKNKNCFHTFLFLSLLLCIFSGCKPKGDERVYGNWYEPLEGGKVSFNRDETIDWFGQRGTFEFKKNSNILCGISVSGCPDGEVKIKVGKQSFRTGYKFKKEKPDHWVMNFRKIGGGFKNVTLSSNKFLSGLALIRRKSSSIPFHSPDLIRTNIPSNHFYASFNTVGVHREKIYGLLSRFEGDPLQSYNSTNHSWEKMNLPQTNDEDSMIAKIGKEVLLYGTFEELNYSLNGGQTWKEVPDFYRFGPYNITDEILTTGIYIYKSFLFQMVQKDIDDHQQTRRFQLIRLDLEANDPRWSKVWEVQTYQDGHHSFDFAFLEKTNDILLIARNLKKRNIHHSSDGGDSWNILEDPISQRLAQTDNYYKIIHSSTSVLASSPSQTFYWFRGETDEWKKITGKFKDARLHENTIWFIKDWQIYKRDYEGNEVKIGQKLPISDFRTPMIEPLSGHVFLDCYTIWELKRNLY